MSQLKVGIIGAGGIARGRHLPCFQRNKKATLVAIADVVPDLVEQAAQQFNIPAVYNDYQKMLEKEQLDAVVICTPNKFHAPMTIDALRSGVHVLCEKPMALNVSECDQMLAACRAHNVKLGVAYYRHFYPIVHRIKSLIESGEIGVPVVVQINSFEWFDPGLDHPRAWLLNKDVSGGGPMFDFGCHRIEVLLDVFGKVSKISALRANRFFQRDVEDVASVLFQFERGVAGVLTVAHSAGEPQDTFDVFGSRGSIHVPVLNKGEIRIVTEAGERTELHAPRENIHQPLLEDFIDAVLNDRQPQVGGEIGRAVAEVLEMVYAD